MGLNTVTELLRIKALLGQLKINSIRNDFLAGCIHNVENKDKLLETLDAMDDLLFPEWISYKTGLLTLLTVASEHLQSLLNHSSDLLEIPMETNRYVRCSYSDWMHTLDGLINSNYWTDKKEKRLAISEILEVSDGVSVKSLPSSPLPIAKAKIIPRKSSHTRANSTDVSMDYKMSSRRISRTPELCFAQTCQYASDMEISDSSDASEEEFTSDTDSEQDLYSLRSYIHKYVVAPQIFQSDGTQTLHFFLRKFEHYFRAKYHGNERDCTQVLGKFIAGDVMEAYEALGGSHLKYSDMKVGLLQWYRSHSAGKAPQYRSELRQSTMKVGESLTIYCMRLHEIANRAFLRNIKERLKQFKQQLVSTVPESFVKSMEEREEMKFLSGIGKRLTLKDITGIAEKLDRKINKDRINRSTAFSKSKEFKRQTTVEGSESEPGETNRSHRVSNGHMGRSTRPPQCHFCGCRGHLESQCWLRLGACTICGSQSHKYVQCPNYSTARCSLCSGPHLGKDCSLQQT